jgi:hypothetical protein
MLAPEEELFMLGWLRHMETNYKSKKRNIVCGYQMLYL